MNLYILKCKNGKYYVGTTKLDVTKRLVQHMKGMGSAWTKKHKPLWVEKEIENCDAYDEDKWTKIYMDKYGIKNVRGGSYAQMELSSGEINLLEREVNHANNKCLNCGKRGHYIKQCPTRKKPVNKKYISSSDDDIDDELTIDDVEQAFEEEMMEDGVYERDGKKYLWESGSGLFEESPHRRCGARDGTFYESESHGYWRPIKKKKRRR
tara:strand:+ start:98 stop:724 length:627 start_codon:yes stop_codon:yes gene_type:complete